MIPPTVRSWYLAMGAILMGAAFLRFSPLVADWPLISDEVFSWNLASHDDPRIAIQITAGDVHPPLYYLLLWAWIRLAGESPAALKALSGLLGVLCVAATAWFAGLWAEGADTPRRRNTALLAAVLVAVSTPLIAVSTTARMYSLLTLETLLACGTLLIALRRPRLWRWWAAWAVACAWLLYTHNYGIFMVAGQAIWLALEVILRPHWMDRGRVLRRGALALVAVALIYLPWLPWFLSQRAEVQAGYWIQHLDWRHISTLAVQWVMEPIYDEHVQLLSSPEHLMLGFLTLMVLWPWRWASGERFVGVIVLSHALFIWGVYYFTAQSIMNPRHLIHLLPLAAAPMSYWLLASSRPLLRNLAAGAAVAGSAAATGLWLSHPDHGVPDFTLGRATAHVARYAGPGDSVLFLDAGSLMYGRYFLVADHGRRDLVSFVPGDRRDLGEPRLVVFGSLLRPADLLDLNDPRLTGRSIWVITCGGSFSPPRHWRWLDPLGGKDRYPSCTSAYRVETRVR